MLQGTGICTSVYVGIYMTHPMEAPRRPTAILVAIESISWVSTKLSKWSFDTPTKNIPKWFGFEYIYIYMKMTSMGILGLWKVSDLPGRPDSPKVIRMPSRFLLLLPPQRRGYYGPTWPETDVRCLKCHLEDVDGRRSAALGFLHVFGLVFLGSCEDVLYITVISAGMEKRDWLPGIRDRSNYMQ